MTKHKKIWVKDGHDSWGTHGHWYQDARGGGTEYTLTSTVAAQLKAADELAEAITNEREMVCQDMALQAQVSKRLEDAITAYRKAKDEAQ